MYKTEMFKKFQQTIAKKVCFEGIGLHSGRSSKITLNPGKEDQGIIFKRTDLHENNKVVAKFSNVSLARLCTTIENEHGVKVSTIEHLLAALYICDIDNVEIEINSEEVPIMDGSAKDFVDVLKNTEKSVLNQEPKVKPSVLLIVPDRLFKLMYSFSSKDIEYTFSSPEPS